LVGVREAAEEERRAAVSAADGLRAQLEAASAAAAAGAAGLQGAEQAASRATAEAAAEKERRAVADETAHALKEERDKLRDELSLLHERAAKLPQRFAAGLLFGKRMPEEDPADLGPLEQARYADSFHTLPCLPSTRTLPADTRRRSG